ncbi:uncharacterized protein T551_01922 [Pneumocystis jirovecii RU7]|uniref:Uncharacterized protein n=1 Tax=Pneumocystis jirovecii (strain RU7) TaxID=1408657 RepID=A0A0W4ZNN1_PNEJ7|nr:uncharacterized protein T551_01922 [Pneumocystis jirovecii RU7]KTW29978.1 hypothetical protein T551_01922 [Pneumocystis jirovecii RU7]
MNKPWSMALGWASLIATAGIGYYFAKKDINARRREQMAYGNIIQEKLDWKERIELDEKRMRKDKKSMEEIQENENLTKNATKHSLESTSSQPYVKLKQKENR